MTRRKEGAPAGARHSGVAGRYAYEGLDRLMHEKARLGIMTSLLAHREGLHFQDLKELCALTDGNLSRHLAVLAEDGAVEIRKGRQGSRPQTSVRLGTEGRARFLEYLAELERVIRDGAQARAAASAHDRSGAWKGGRGWLSREGSFCLYLRCKVFRSGETMRVIRAARGPPRPTGCLASATPRRRRRAEDPETSRFTANSSKPGVNDERAPRFFHREKPRAGGSRDAESLITATA